MADGEGGLVFEPIVEPQPMIEFELEVPLVELLGDLPQPASHANARLAPRTKKARFETKSRRTSYPVSTKTAWQIDSGRSGLVALRWRWNLSEGG